MRKSETKAAIPQRNAWPVRTEASEDRMVLPIYGSIRWGSGLSFAFSFWAYSHVAQPYITSKALLFFASDMWLDPRPGTLIQKQDQEQEQDDRHKWRKWLVILAQHTNTEQQIAWQYEPHWYNHRNAIYFVGAKGIHHGPVTPGLANRITFSKFPCLSNMNELVHNTVVELSDTKGFLRRWH